MNHLPPDCALHRSLTDDKVGWGLAEQLLATIADAIRMGNWQRGGDSKVKRPSPIPRPGVVDDTVVGERIGSERPVEEIRSIFDARRRTALEGAVTDGD